jgi:hypothetical protein
VIAKRIWRTFNQEGPATYYIDMIKVEIEEYGLTCDYFVLGLAQVVGIAQMLGEEDVVFLESFGYVSYCFPGVEF